MNEERQAASNTLRLENDRPIKETREAHERLMKIASEVGISAAARIARGPVKKALLQAAAELTRMCSSLAALRRESQSDDYDLNQNA
jgi:hypothetical protein